MEDVVESCFESLNHKYNVVRKHFAKERHRKGSAPLIYQPMRLREASWKSKYTWLSIANITPVQSPSEDKPKEVGDTGQNEKTSQDLGQDPPPNPERNG